MRVRQPYDLPAEKRPQMRRAKKLAWLTIGWILTIVVVIYLTMGASQAMRTALVEDLLTMIPPIGFLIATYVEENRPPSERFPYGHYRLSAIAFLASAVALFGMGLYLLYESVLVLLTREHVTIGVVELFGLPIWLGWLMVAANIYAGVIPFILGRKKTPVARAIHEKTLYASARMDRADWMTAATAAAGIIGIGFGIRWADAVAAGIISLDIARDGYRNLRHAMADLMDEIPTPVGTDEQDPILDRIRERLEQMAWIKEAQVRIREEGHVLTGEAFIVPNEEMVRVEQLESSRREIERLDWRLYDLAVIPVRELPKEEEDRRME